MSKNVTVTLNRSYATEDDVSLS